MFQLFTLDSLISKCCLWSVILIQKVELCLQVLTHDLFLLGDDIRQIIDDSSSEVNMSSSDFWVLVAALKVSSL
jgi:hypothetical protein